MKDFFNQLESLEGLSNDSDSRKGLALAIDQFLTDNAGTGFAPFELGDKFGVEPAKLRGILRDVLGLGTKKKGKRFAKSSNTDFVLYCLPYPNEGAKNQYVAFKVGINPLTGKKMESTSPKK